jgi:hypothetical protein
MKNEREYFTQNAELIKKLHDQIKENEELNKKFFQPFEEFKKWQNEQNRKMRLREEVTDQIEDYLFEFHDMEKDVWEKLKECKEKNRKALMYGYSMEKKNLVVYGQFEKNYLEMQKKHVIKEVIKRKEEKKGKIYFKSFLLK